MRTWVYENAKVKDHIWTGKIKGRQNGNQTNSNH